MEICTTNNETGVNDTLGVYLRPEYNMYSTSAPKVEITLYNYSGATITYGLGHVITYEDEVGIWRELPINNAVFDVAYGIFNNSSINFSALLYPEKHTNKAGRYRFLLSIEINGKEVLFMTEFRLTEDEQELKNTKKTLDPYAVDKGEMTEETTDYALIYSSIPDSLRGKELAVQEPGNTYGQRLFEAFDTIPAWYSGSFINAKDRLTIMVTGDSLVLRKKLIDLLQGEEFDVRTAKINLQLLKDSISSIMRTEHPYAKHISICYADQAKGKVVVGFSTTEDSIIEGFKKHAINSPYLHIEKGVSIIFDEDLPTGMPSDSVINPVVYEKADFEADEDGFYFIAEEMPEFPGGMTELYRFIQDNKRYPEDAKKASVQGRVHVQFVINQDGTITNPVVVRSVFPSLDKEALRIIRIMPSWKPGKIQGEAVKMKMVTPITFSEETF